jgi:hypothetical protein
MAPRGPWGMGTTENDGCIERLGAIRASYRVNGQAHAQAGAGWPTTPDLNDAGRRAAHEDIREEDWADPGVVVWLLRQGAVVPQRRVLAVLPPLRTYLQELKAQCAEEDTGFVYAALERDVQLLERLETPA